MPAKNPGLLPFLSFALAAFALDLVAAVAFVALAPRASLLGFASALFLVAFTSAFEDGAAAASVFCVAFFLFFLLAIVATSGAMSA